MAYREITPDEIVEFWFPDGPAPEPEQHQDLWVWRMRGGAHNAVVERYSEITKRAAEGDLDGWAETARGRLALIILLDQFSRSVWAGTPEAFAQDPKALDLCLKGLDNGHFDALENVWQKSVFKLPLEHCECPEHLANLNRAVAIARQIVEEAPEYLRPFYEMGAQQPVKIRAVIAEFGRHPHRNATLGRGLDPQGRGVPQQGRFPAPDRPQGNWKAVSLKRFRNLRHGRWPVGAGPQSYRRKCRPQDRQSLRKETVSYPTCGLATLNAPRVPAACP